MTSEHRLRGLRQRPPPVSRRAGQEAGKRAAEFPAVGHACGQGGGWAACLSGQAGEDSASGSSALRLRGGLLLSLPASDGGGGGEGALGTQGSRTALVTTTTLEAAVGSSRVGCPWRQISSSGECSGPLEGAPGQVGVCATRLLGLKSTVPRSRSRSQEGYSATDTRASLVLRRGEIGEEPGRSELIPE